MFKQTLLYLMISVVITMAACTSSPKHDFSNISRTPEQVLGNPDFRAISYGGYRDISRSIQPTVDELKEDMQILYAMGIRIVRTYNVHYNEASNLLKAIQELRLENPEFEMYVMLGAWIDAKNAFSDLPERIRDQDSERNAPEIARAVQLVQQYPEIVLVLAVGNEAMVHWAWEYHVEPQVILNWVRHLQDLKRQGQLPNSLWITSSDNFAAWGGGGPEYHKPALTELIHEVDYISMHTYPMHDTHYNPDFWGVREQELGLSDIEKIDAAMYRARDYAIGQYESVVSYMKSVGVDKPVHIGESGWSTVSNEFYGAGGAQAIDEYKAGMFHRLMRDWTDANGISLFYFQAFDEPWKDATNPLGSENHFGLIDLQGRAKYAIWDLVDQGVFEGLSRAGNPIVKSYGGSLDSLMLDVLVPPTQREIDARRARN